MLMAINYTLVMRKTEVELIISLIGSFSRTQ